VSAVESEIASLRREEQLVAERFVAVEAAVRAARERLSSMPRAQGATAALPDAAEPPMALRVEVEALRRDRGRLEDGVARARGEIDRLSSEDPLTLRRELEEAEGTRAIAEEALRNAEGNLAGALAAHRAWSGRDRAAQAGHAEANRRWREQAAEVERLREEHEELD